MNSSVGLTEAIFILTVLCTFAASFLALRHARRESREGRDGLAGQKLNRWLVGLSAGTTANSGFIVTAAVGLGYSFGLLWMLLPISWLLGDLVFWYLFPARINRLGRESKATTLSELLCAGLKGPSATALA